MQNIPVPDYKGKLSSSFRECYIMKHENQWRNCRPAFPLGRRLGVPICAQIEDGEENRQALDWKRGGE